MKTPENFLAMPNTLSGLDVLLQNPSNYLKGKVGLVANHTSVCRNLTHSIQHLLNMKGVELARLFGPEHGLWGVDQDMIHVDGEHDPLSGLAIHSLYGKDEASLKPQPELLNGLDQLVFDIQDIGSRYYTFIYTMAFCMQTAKEAGVPMLVLDRPNPIKGIQTEGNLVREGWYSFVGQYPLPNRHGMTAGELAKLFNEHFGIGCDLTVVPMQGWQRGMWFEDTGLPWVAPSPNMPTVNTAVVYPGLCLIEGTLLSEGRGTTRPFEQIGAPGIQAFELAKCLNDENLPGVSFRPQYFKPQFQKHAGEVCGGVELYVTDREIFKPVLTGVALIRTIHQLFPTSFEWRTEPYEYVSDRPAIDLLYGHPELRESLMPPTVSLTDIESSWQAELEQFKHIGKDFYLY